MPRLAKARPASRATGSVAIESGLGRSPAGAVTSTTNSTETTLFVAAKRISPATMSATEHGGARIAEYRFRSWRRVNDPEVDANDALFIAAEGRAGVRNGAWGSPSMSATKRPSP